MTGSDKRYGDKEGKTEMACYEGYLLIYIGWTERPYW